MRGELEAAGISREDFLEFLEDNAK
jgi:hypothetical protein